MRVTNQSITRNSVSRLQQNLQQVERLRRDVSTGKRLHAISEDPSSGSQMVRIGSSLRAIEQFRRNIRIGTGRASAEENALDSLTTALGRAVELSVTQSSATSNAQTRTIAKQEVDQLISYAVSLGNMKFGDEYLFGGTRAGQAPLRVPPSASDGFSALQDTNGDPVDPSGNPTMEIGDGRFVTPNHNASEIFLDTNALQALRDLSTALGANDAAGIAAATASLTTASSDVQTLIGQQGARAAEFQIATDTLGALELSLEGFSLDLSGTEIERAMVDLVAKQNQYQAAMAATSRVLSLSLANYI